MPSRHSSRRSREHIALRNPPGRNRQQHSRHQSLRSPHHYLGCPDFIWCHSQIPQARARARRNPCGPATGGDSVSLGSDRALIHPSLARERSRGFMIGKQGQRVQALKQIPGFLLTVASNLDRQIPFLLLLLCIYSFACVGAAAQDHATNGSCPPATRKDATVDILHGVSIPDPYRWLEDQNSPETRSWIEAQNRCTSAALDALPGRAQISRRLGELQKIDSFTIPL